MLQDLLDINEIQGNAVGDHEELGVQYGDGYAQLPV